MTISKRVRSDDGLFRVSDFIDDATGKVIGEEHVDLVAQADDAAVEQRRVEMRKVLDAATEDPKSIAELVAVVKAIAFGVLAIDDVKGAREAAGELAAAAEIAPKPLRG